MKKDLFDDPKSIPNTHSFVQWGKGLDFSGSDMAQTSKHHQSFVTI
jgi:hypothetical protein